jgi:diguanylate cyclase (GGDEF)-like protein/putative nucleotidyltransferase with HDIG domain
MEQASERNKETSVPRVLVVHTRRRALPYQPSELGSWSELTATIPYGVEALRLLVERECSVIVADLGDRPDEAAAFLEEARRLWPWFSLVALRDPAASAAAASAKDRLAAQLTLDAPVPVTRLQSACRDVGRGRKWPGALVASRPGCPNTQILVELSSALQKAIATSTLVGGFHEIAASLIQCLPHDLVALLGMAEDPVINLSARTSVHVDVLDKVEREVLTRFRALSGCRLERESVRVVREGAACDAVGSRDISRLAGMPIVQEGEVVGLLAFADVGGSSSFTPDEIQSLAIVAAQVGSVFTVLRTMRGLASLDPLTGALNRMGLEDALERSWQLSRRYVLPMGVAVVDLDHFKMLNDSYGHSAGDEVIREFAHLLREVCRGSDVVARYGGDEFVVILPQADEVAARIFSERLLAATRQRVFCRQTHRMRMTVSIGLSTTQSPLPPATGSELLNQADRALYISKREGRNRFCVWPENTETAPSRPSPATALSGGSGTGGEPSAEEKPGYRGRLLVVDDEEMVRKTVQVILRTDGYEVDACDSADVALHMMRKEKAHTYDVVLTDLNMPGKSGIELLQEIAVADASVIKIVITGFATVDNAVSSLREGAYDFIQKPLRATQLIATVRRALEFRRLKVENARYHAHLEELVRERSAQLAASLEEIRRSHEFTLEALVAMLDARENQTARHSLRVRDLAVALGKRVGFDEEELRALGQGALLHDIGKISITDAILLKPGPLLPEEWEIMRRHPETGYRILKPSAYLKDAAMIVWQHHECFDGSGYPRGLRGEDICVGARIFKLVDVYEATRSERVYRSAMCIEDVVKIIRGGSGTAFDPRMAEVFLNSIPEMERVLALT